RQLEAVEQVVDKELEGLKEFDKDEVDRKTPERIVKQDDILRHREMLNRIDSNIIALRAELRAPDRVQVYQRAEVPTKSEMKKQLAVTGFAGFAGLGLVGGCVTLYELRRKRVYGPKDPLFRRLSLLGSVPDYELPPVSARTDALDPAGRQFF